MPNGSPIGVVSMSYWTKLVPITIPNISAIFLSRLPEVPTLKKLLFLPNTLTAATKAAPAWTLPILVITKPICFLFFSNSKISNPGHLYLLITFAPLLM